MRSKTPLLAALLILTGIVAMASPASSLIVGNTLSLSTASAPAGDTATVTLSLSNEDALSGIQADVIFDDQVAAFSNLTVTERGVGMTAEGRVVSSGHLRVILYFDDSSSLPSADGALAELSFTLQGNTDDETTLVFQDIILSNPDGGALTGTGTSGLLTVLAPENPPALTLAVLKNPGNTHITNVMVTVTGGSGDLPTVTAGSTAIVMHDLGAGVFEGQYYVPSSSSSLTFSASDTNIHGTGTKQVSLAFP